MNRRTSGEIHIDKLKLRVPGVRTEPGSALGRRVAEQLEGLLPDGLSGEIALAKLEVRADRHASHEQLATAIAKSIAASLVRGAATSPPSSDAPGAKAAEREADAAGDRIGEELRETSGVQAGSLPTDVREVAERHLGVDLSGTRLVSDSHAQRRAASLDALAVTEGSIISFAAGQLSTSTHEGRALLGHELTHVAQQKNAGTTRVQLKPNKAKPAGKPVKDAETARVVNLKADYAAAVSGKDWGRAALLLNGFAATDLELRLRQLEGTEQAELRRGAIRAMPGFSERVTNAIDALNPGARRMATLLDEYESHLVASRWLEAALTLNGFSDADIGKRLDGLSQLQLASMKAAAHEGMRGFSARIVAPIEKRLTTKTRPTTKAESSVLSHMERLAIAARSEGDDGQRFSKAANELRVSLRVSLETVAPGAALPSDLEIVMKALMLWDTDPGTKWGEGTWDSTDLVPTATDYATVPAAQNKCNAYVAEVVFQSVGAIFKVYQAEKAPGKFFPFRAADWGNPKTPIPNFPVVASPLRGDVWSSGTHVGIYLGEYAGRKLYVSARDNGDGVLGLGSELQKPHGVQVKFLPSGGVYRRYTP